MLLHHGDKQLSMRLDSQLSMTAYSVPTFVGYVLEVSVLGQQQSIRIE
jgi:hypothetical protein